MANFQQTFDPQEDRIAEAQELSWLDLSHRTSPTEFFSSRFHLGDRAKLVPPHVRLVRRLRRKKASGFPFATGCFHKKTDQVINEAGYLIGHVCRRCHRFIG